MTGKLYFKTFCLLVLLNLGGKLTCQDSLYFENLTSKEKYVLLLGIENVLKFEPSIDNILFNAENILKQGVVFRIRPNQVGPVTVMLFSGTSMKGSIDFEVKINKVDLQGNLVKKVRLGSLPEGGMVTVYELLNNPVLKIYKGKILEPSFEIVSYDVTYIQKNGNVIESEQKSAELNKTILNYIKQAKSGDIMLIENVKVKSLDSTFRKLPGLSYQIK